MPPINNIKDAILWFCIYSMWWAALIDLWATWNINLS